MRNSPTLQNKVRFHTIWLWTWTPPIFTLVERGNHYFCHIDFQTGGKRWSWTRSSCYLIIRCHYFSFFPFPIFIQGWAYSVLRKEMLKKVWRKSQTMEKLFSPEVLKKFQMNRIRQIVQPLFLENFSCILVITLANNWSPKSL